MKTYTVSVTMVFDSLNRENNTDSLINAQIDLINKGLQGMNLLSSPQLIPNKYWLESVEDAKD